MGLLELLWLLLIIGVEFLNYRFPKNQIVRWTRILIVLIRFFV